MAAEAKDLVFCVLELELELELLNQGAESQTDRKAEFPQIPAMTSLQLCIRQPTCCMSTYGKRGAAPVLAAHCLQ